MKRYLSFWSTDSDVIVNEPISIDPLEGFGEQWNSHDRTWLGGSDLA
jgi:hypothetical protein